MEKKIYSLRTNVGFYYNKPIGYSHSFSISHDEIFIEPDLNLRNFNSENRFSRTREGLLLESKVRGEIQVNCGRCLSDFTYAIEVSFNELFVFPQRLEEPTDTIIPDDGYIDLGIIYREYLLLEIPINPICSPQCKGLCEICGQNLNEKGCEHSRIVD